jgi:hypothetical protein
MPTQEPDSPNPQPDVGTKIESPLGDELTQVGAKTIEIYQTQMGFVSRAWRHFSLYSVAMVVLSMVLLSDKDITRDGRTWGWEWVIPLFTYLALIAGNYRALSLTLYQLFHLRGLAIAQSGLDLKGSEPAVSKRFHVLISSLVVIVYVSAWLFL